MITAVNTVAAYLDQVSPEHKTALKELRKVIKNNLPAGFEERIQYGMIGYVVPLKVYPPGYHVDPAQPLPFISLASQKNFIAIYHMGLYANEGLLKWFLNEYAALLNQKPDMGKSCIRFRNFSKIPFELIGALSGRMTTAAWIGLYEKAIVQNKSRKTT